MSLNGELILWGYMDEQMIGMLGIIFIQGYKQFFV